MIVLIIISFLLAVIIGILFLPLTFIADSEDKEYSVSIPVFFKIWITGMNVIEEGIFVRIFFFRYRINPLVSGKTKKIKNKPTQNRNRKPTKIAEPFLLVRKIFRRFKIKRFYANIDTGDFPLNAQLIPVANTLNNEKINLQINFEDQNQVDIKIITRLGLLAATYIHHKIVTH